MTKLANANLLDESVANSGSLKNERMRVTAQAASNPQPKKEYSNMDNQQEEDEDTDFNNEVREDYGTSKVNYSSNSGNTKKSVNNDSDENTILGMKPILFYSLLGAVAIVGGIWAYRKFGKKGKAASAPSGSGSAAPSGIPEVKI
jgi:hypothetical protein